MRLIHTFVPSNPDSKEGKHRNIIWKELIYVQMLSALLAKREYGKIDLYTNNPIKDLVLEIGIPYDNIDTEVLGENRSELFSIPKLRVYNEINEPFIHIDTDTLIYKKIDFSRFDNSVMFSHPDIKKPVYEDTEKMNDIFTSYPSLDESDSFFKSARVTYLDLFHHLINQHSEFKRRNIRISEIPNMNILMVRDFENFRYASKLSLDHYEKNKSIIDSFKNGECYSEQLMIHLNLLEISESYRRESKDFSQFIMKGTPFSLDAKMGSHLEVLEYPFTIIHNSHTDFDVEDEIKINGVLYKRSNEYHQHFGRSTKVNSKENLIDLFDFDFFGVSHLTFYKWSEIFQAIVIGYIINKFGEDYVRSIYEYYKKVYPTSYSLPILSKGEMLYQELTGFEFERNRSLF